MKEVSTDKQTHADLSIAESLCGEQPLSSLFLKTETKQGRCLMMEWLTHPLSDRDQILKRQGAIAWSDLPELPLEEEELDFIEYYLSYSDQLHRANVLLSCVTAFDRLFRHDSKRYVIVRGVELIALLLHRLNKWEQLFPSRLPQFWEEALGEIHDILHNSPLSSVPEPDEDKRFRFSIYETDKYDYLFRHTCRQYVGDLLSFVYTLDVCRTVRRVAKARQFCCAPEISQDSSFSVQGLAHPFVKDARRNDWEMYRGNICFFTGSNMAGKSTTLKALTLSVWLTHCGLPVPAESMVCPLYEGIYTSINLPDSLRDGRSHFMAEVLRIKEVLDKVKEGKKCLFVLDEMFRGTNATDAYEASVAVNEILKGFPDCHFLVSTHILEYAKTFADDPSCCFYYMEAEIKNDTFLCPHRLLKGISEARVGYWLVKKYIGVGDGRK